VKQRADHVIKLRISKRKLQRIATHRADLIETLRLFEIDSAIRSFNSSQPLELSIRLPGPRRSDTQQLTEPAPMSSIENVFRPLRFNLAQYCRLQTVRVADPAVHELELPDTIIVLVCRVVTGVDVFEPVTSLLESVEHVWTTD
jgi:hypothetical protein